MPPFVAVLVLCPWLAPAARAGSIEGTVRLDGPKQAALAAVYVQSAPGTFTPPKDPVRLSQRGQAFRPPLVPVLVGSRVDMSNDDYVTHNIFSKSEAKTFDLERQEAGFPGAPKADKDPKAPPPPDPVLLFERLGVVDMRCNIHPKMYGVILVLQNPYFAQPDKEGAFKIDNVPKGSYDLQLYVASADGAGPARTESRKVSVPAKGSVKVSFQ